MKSRREPFTCPVCGEEVSPNAKACPECGACDKSGWSQSGGDDLPDDDFDYDKFVADEFGGSPKPTHLNWWWWGVAVAVLVAFLLLMFLRWGAVF